jgi:hypothetical protein
MQSLERGIRDGDSRNVRKFSGRYGIFLDMGHRHEERASALWSTRAGKIRVR